MPAKVHGHRLTLNVTPERWTGPQDESTPNRPKQRPGITVLKDKPAGDTVRQVFQRAIGYGIRQSARAAHQRQRAVFQTVKLRQAAGFETARHQDDVRAAHDAVRERFVIANLHAHLPRMFRRGGKEAFLQHRVARAEQRQLSPLLQ